MKTNMGLVDRAIRVVVAVLIGALYFMNVISGPVTVVLSIVAAAFVVTSLIGFCPLYRPFRISTRKRKSTNA